MLEVRPHPVTSSCPIRRHPILPSCCCIDADLSGSPAFPVPRVVNHTQVVHILELPATSLSLSPLLGSSGFIPRAQHCWEGSCLWLGESSPAQHSLLWGKCQSHGHSFMRFVLLFSANVCVHPFTCICLVLHTLSDFSWALINLYWMSEGLFESLSGRTSHKAEPPSYLLRLAKR